MKNSRQTESFILETINNTYPKLKITEIHDSDIEYTENFMFIACHSFDTVTAYSQHRYFILCLDKYQFNKVVFSDSNIIDRTAIITAYDASISARGYFLSTFNKIYNQILNIGK